ncbi:MAG: amidohydrolase [Deltaproteobacteria bacterium]|nr:amidohydrolase [Deltaproteobacteria bacterium]
MRDWLSRIRRHLHAHPELSGREHQTTAFVRHELTDLGAELLDYPGPTGVVGLIRGSEPGPVIALRADMDALPLQEMNKCGYRSQRDGVMHACGHDAHTAMLLGVAREICRGGELGNFRGAVKLIFQPAEENGTGAAQMVANGVLQNPTVDKVFACHMTPETPVGTVRVFGEAGYASNDHFKVTVTGQGSHGARPEESRDPLMAAVHLAAAAQTIVSRNVKPTEAAVVSVCRFHSGTGYNLIPQEAMLEGTLRALKPSVRELLIKRLEEMCACLEGMFQVDCRLEMLEHIPACNNDPRAGKVVRLAAAEVVGPEKVIPTSPIMGSEDFSHFTNALPSAIFQLGGANPDKGISASLHNPYFDIDEAALPLGVEVFLHILRNELSLEQA